MYQHHHENLQIFQDFIAYCRQLGDLYAPRLEHLQLQFFQNMYDKAVAQLHILETQDTIFAQTVELLEGELQYLKPYLQRVSESVEASKMNLKLKNHALVWLRKTLNYDIHEPKAKKQTERTAEYRALVELLNKCIEIIEEAGKSLDETGLERLEELKNIRQRIEKLFDDAKQAEKQLEAANKNLHLFFYFQFRCLFELMAEARKYIKAVAGADSDAFTAAEAIQLKRPKR